MTAAAKKTKKDKKARKSEKARLQAAVERLELDQARDDLAAQRRKRFKVQAQGAAAAGHAGPKSLPAAVLQRRRPVEPPPKLDARGYARAKATMPGYHAGKAPASKGKTYPPSALETMDIVALMRACPDTPEGRRLRAWIAIDWQTGMRIAETLAILEEDLKPRKGSIRIRSGKGGKPRTVTMSPWGWDELAPWVYERRSYPTGPLFCVLNGPTKGVRAWEGSQVRYELHRLALDAGVRARVHPHAFRHTFTCDWVRAGLPLHLLQKQLGHADLRVTTRYLVSISDDELLTMGLTRSAPELSVPDLMEMFRNGR